MLTFGQPHTLAGYWAMCTFVKQLAGEIIVFVDYMGEKSLEFGKYDFA